MKLLFVFLISTVTVTAQLRPADFIGAWEREDHATRTTMICSDQFFAVSVYQVDNKKFIGTYGGRFRINAKKLIEQIEFNTMHPELVGTETVIQLGSYKEGKLFVTEASNKFYWNKVDDGTPGVLAGTWLITSRNVDGEKQSIIPGARKTMKILSGTHFQWIAYNSETKEFFGTGGGTYNTVEGKYTESILFFSRDSSRVGAILQFDFVLAEDNWHHKGLSSKGDPIDEVWTKREQLGL